jgi:hypothetical protein
VPQWRGSFAGSLFGVLLFVTMLWLIARPAQPVPDEARWLLRVFTALAGAGLAAVLSGMLTVDLKLPSLAVRATSGFAVFVLLYLVNPPRQGSEPKGPSRVNQRQKVGPSARGTQVVGDHNRSDR